MLMMRLVKIMMITAATTIVIMLVIAIIMREFLRHKEETENKFRYKETKGN